MTYFFVIPTRAKRARKFLGFFFDKIDFFFEKIDFSFFPQGWDDWMTEFPTGLGSHNDIPTNLSSHPTIWDDWMTGGKKCLTLSYHTLHYPTLP